MFHSDKTPKGPHAPLRIQRTLAEYPGDWIDLRCLKCPRRGRRRKAPLLARYGGAFGLVTLIRILAPADCPLNRPDPSGMTPCGACYGPELPEPPPSEAP